MIALSCLKLIVLIQDLSFSIVCFDDTPLYITRLHLVHPLQTTNNIWCSFVWNRGDRIIDWHHYNNLINRLNVGNIFQWPYWQIYISFLRCENNEIYKLNLWTKHDLNAASIWSRIKVINCLVSDTYIITRNTLTQASKMAV